MHSPHQIPDRRERELAETTFDRNVVVVAGAGTGKTTLLVNRMIHLLMKEPDPVGITHLVALTFTNKAATEMKVRLRERLTALIRPSSEFAAESGFVSLPELQAAYHLTPEQIATRAAAALKDLEKAQIGTLHSFAAHLLRLHPLESGVDPAFQEDDGSRFDEHFTAAWNVWIDQELSRHGTNHGLWRTVLRNVSLEDLQALTRALCSELVDIPLLCEQLDHTVCAPLVVEWLAGLRERGQSLLEAHDRPKRRKIEQLLAASLSLLARLADKGPFALTDIPLEEREWLAKDLGNAVGGWEAADFQEASRIIKSAQAFLNVDQSFFKYALKLLAPLVMEIRSDFVRHGWLSFDGLLARARLLLRNHPSVRERIKQEYAAVLVDEFQDTDPVQYEIMLAVCERRGLQARAWEDMKLEPGKLCIVGDPKQSIYAFRRADIEAFDRVVEKIEADGGVIQTLTTNFRSDAAVLEPVNEVFDRVFERRPHVQPANVRLVARPNRRPASQPPGVHLHLAAPPEGRELFDAAGATRSEAEVLGRWLAEDVLARPGVKAGHVAFLFRTLTQAEVYLDALRRYGIAYTIEGEKHFYRRAEIIDLINVLRVLDNPHDIIALVGVLRSPLGGLTDRDLYDLRRAGWCDYRQHRRLDGWPHACASQVRRLYVELDRLHRDITALPLADAIQLLFERLPILELAAASVHGEQVLANLLKAKQTAGALADRPHLTLSGFVDLMIGRLDEQPDEAESPLVEESLDAIQVLTVHKAKGLEFPIVVLPGLHQGTGRDRSVPSVSYDWSSGTYGLSVGKRHSFGSVLIQDKWMLRERAERRRVLYVGMTRAKELLVLSGGVTARMSGDNVLGLLQDIGQGVVGAASTTALSIGASSIPHIVTVAPDRKRPRRRDATRSVAPPIDFAATAALWDRRRAAWTKICSTPRRLTPSLMGQSNADVRQGRGNAEEAEISRLVGVLAHRILEQWPFAEPGGKLSDNLAATVERGLGAGQHHLRDRVTESLREMFRVFGASDLYTRLRTATILGREIPFVMPWDEGQVMEGVIDLLYRLDGTLWIADYKTDAVLAGKAVDHAERYRTQSLIYKTAVSQSLGMTHTRFHCLFLRCATSVEL